jgi:hypothetical protein
MKQTESVYILILKPLPPLAYHSPSVAKVPANIAARYLDASAAIKIDEHLYRKYRSHHPFHMMVIAAELAKEKGIDIPYKIRY